MRGSAEPFAIPGIPSGPASPSFARHVKLKEVFFGLGIRPAVQEYTFDLEQVHLETDGDVDVAIWRHPSVLKRHEPGRGCSLTQAAVDAVRQFLRPGDVAIDIGAHTGDSTLPIALTVGRAGVVLALEPNVYAYKVLLANAGLNRARTNIIPLNVAATPDDGPVDFEYSDPGFCNGGKHNGVGAWTHAHFFRQCVAGRNLPRLLATAFPEEATRIRYIKIDAEGYDRTIAASMHDLLAEQHPFLKTEIYKHLPREERVGYYRDLRDLGYELFRIEGDDADYRSRRVAECELMNWSHFDMFASPE